MDYCRGSATTTARKSAASLGSFGGPPGALSFRFGSVILGGTVNEAPSDSAPPYHVAHVPRAPGAHRGCHRGPSTPPRRPGTRLTPQVPTNSSTPNGGRHHYPSHFDGDGGSPRERRAERGAFGAIAALRRIEHGTGPDDPSRVRG